MECDRRIFISIVLIFVSASLTRNELVQNVSSASAIRLDSVAARTFSKKTKLNGQMRYLDVIETYSNCSGLEILSEEFQPKYSSESSFIRKCCPGGQSYEISENGRQCAVDTLKFNNFNVSILNATFYENCIEDNESGPTLDLVYVDACNSEATNNKKEPKNQKVLYSKLYGDLLYVLQNGSLLTVDENFEGYEVHNNYCLDMNRNDGFLYAIVCDQKSSHQTKTNRVLRAEAYLYSTCLLISVPCLLLTAFFYVKIDELRDLHGKSLACHCVSLATAYSFLIVIQFQQDILLPVTYFIQYFLLSCICWLCVLCFDICFKISYTYLKKYSCSVNTEDKYFTAYAIVSFGLPILPVVVASSHHMFGIPLYYIKGQHNINTSTDDYYIIPAAILLGFCCCFLLMTLYFFGTRRPKAPHGNQGPEAICEYEEFFKLKQTAQSVAFLFALMSVCMIIEMLTSHINASTNPNADVATISPFAFFDVLIALQGVFIFIIFICSPKPLRIVKRWWVANGTLDVAALTELEALKKHTAF